MGEKSDDGGYDTAPLTGLYLATSDVSDQSAKLTIQSKIVNDGQEEKTVTVKAELKHPDSFDEIGEMEATLRFNPEEMCGGGTVKTVEKELVIPAGQSQTFKETITVENPHLWNGMTDPYRYETVLTVTENGQTIDQVSDFVGFRYFRVDRENGFFLNGKSYPLRGVSRHQDFPGKGYALNEEDHNRDIAMIYEIGANSVRLAHYPQDSYIYDLCDQYGIVVWAEIPYLSGNNLPEYTEANEELRKTTKQQLRELILQQYNHPSIVVWGLQNEVGPGNATLAEGWVKDLNNLAHELDPSRLTTMATHNPVAFPWESDLIGWNQYMGWYGGTFHWLGGSIDGRKKEDPKKRPTGISEYGAGGNPYQHEYNEKDSMNNPGGKWHPEEFQSDLHESAIRTIAARPYLWCTYVWNMFDFGSDSRNEGDQPGINDKGLVTYDRMLKKDSFYLYKANWNKQDKFVHLASERFNPRDTVKIPKLKAYSNCDSVSISINGQPALEGRNTGCGVFVWENIEFPLLGDNTVVATGVYDGGTVTDQVVWQRSRGKDTTISSDVLGINLERKTIDLNQEVSVEDLKNIITFSIGQTWRVLQKNGETEEEVTSGKIAINMYLEVTAEDGITKTKYRFQSASISSGKKITASVEKDGFPIENIIDLNQTTRWNGGRIQGKPMEILLDLEQVYRLTDMEIDWYDEKENPRAYYYLIQVSKDGETWNTAADYSANKKQGAVITDMKEVEARYVKICITGCNDPTRECSIWEMCVNGFRMESEKHQIDHDNRIIHVNNGGLSSYEPKDFEKDLVFEGNAEFSWELGGNYYLIDGSLFIVTSKSGKKIVYVIDMPDEHAVSGLVSIGKPVTGSSVQNDNEGKNLEIYINDGDKNTRWAAKKTDPAHFPEWVTIDLEKEYDLSQIKVLFFKHGERAYKYEIQVSKDGKDFHQIVDQKNNSDMKGDYVHDVTGETARYIKLNVTGSSVSYGLASVYELEVFGTAVSSGRYSVSGRVQDQESMLAVPGVKVELYQKDDTEFRSPLASAVTKEDGSYTLAGIASGTYTLRIFNEEYDSRMEIQVNSENITDLIFDVIPQEKPISLGKKVTCSNEEIDAGNLASNINDGIKDNRWSAKVSGQDAKYPQWVTIDLEDVYDLSKAEILFYKHGSTTGGRIYQYQLLTSMTGEEGSFQLVVDASDNAVPGGDYKHDLSGQARYIRINVTGCNQKESYVSASIHELSIFGTKAADMEAGTISGTVTSELDGKPVESLTVLLYDDILASPSNAVSTQTDEMGNYQFENVKKGSCLVEVPAQYGFLKAEKLVEFNTEADITVDFVLKLEEEQKPENGVISGSVTIEPDGKPAEGFNVLLYEALLASPSQADEVQTDESGNYQFENLKEGTYRVEIPEQKGCYGKVKEITLTAGETEIADFSLKPVEETKRLELLINRLPSKTRYQLGESLDLTGLEVALYCNGVLERILEETEYVVGELDSDTTGKKKISVEYNNDEGVLKTEFSVYVYGDQEPEIKVVQLPHKRIYGIGEELETEGLEIRGLNLGDREIVLLEESDYELVYDFSEAGVAAVQVIYKGNDEAELNGIMELTDQFEVLVVDFLPYCVDGIRITQVPYRSVYELDGTLELDGLKVEKIVKATDSNASFAEPISIDDLEIDGDLSNTGKKKICVSYYAEGMEGEEEKFSDVFTVKVTKTAERVLEDCMKAEVLKLKAQIQPERYLTKEEKQEAVANAITEQKAHLELWEDKAEWTKAMMNCILETERMGLDICEMIQTEVKADTLFGNAKANGMALSADLLSQEMQRVTLEIRKSNAEISEEISEKLSRFSAVKINLQLNGNEIDPVLPIEVRIKMPSELKKQNLEVFFNEDGTDPIVQMEVHDDWLYMTVRKNGIYVIGNVKKQNSSGHGGSGSRDHSGNNGISGPSLHLPGKWMKDACGWWYAKTSGGYAKNEWARIHGLWYYFDEQGYMKTGWVQDKNRWYYLQNDGSMLHDQWTMWNGKWYYLQSDGSMLASGWKLWKEKWYYLTGDGSMAVNTITPDNYRVDAQGIYVVK